MEEYRRILGVNESASLLDIRKAYRALARKWHPDRFPEGPERAWAEQKMIDINRAYNACSTRCAPSVSRETEERFGEVCLLIAAGQLSRARALLRAMEPRDAEWNYHFGLMLYERRDFEKAAVYFRIALRLSPDNKRYRLALENAESLTANMHARVLSRLRSLWQRSAI